MGHQQKTSNVASGDGSLNIFDLESLSEQNEEEVEHDDGGRRSEAAAATPESADPAAAKAAGDPSTAGSTKSSSVFDRLYSNPKPRLRGGQSETKTDTASSKPSKSVKGASKPAAGGAKLFRQREPASGDATDRLAVPSEGAEPKAPSVYDRLYKSTNAAPARKTQRRPGAEAAAAGTAAAAVAAASGRRPDASKRRTAKEMVRRSASRASQGDLDSEPEHVYREEDEDDEDRRSTNGNEQETLDEEAEDAEPEPTFNFFFGRPSTAVRSAKSDALKTPPSAQAGRRRKRKSWKIYRIPVSLVERTSLVRGALPVLPLPFAWLCLIFNALAPGVGTVLSGLCTLCCGAPRFNGRVTSEHRLLAIVVNVVIGVFQAMTILFCLVGWCWSLGWGIILVKTANQYKLWKTSPKNDARGESIRRSDTDIATIDSHEYRPRY